MWITRLKLKNWRNFKQIDIALRDRVYLIGPNASGKSNLLDVFRFLRDIAKTSGGGLQKAVKDRHHSEALLRNPGIDVRGVLRLEPGKEGTRMRRHKRRVPVMRGDHHGL